LKILRVRGGGIPPTGGGMLVFRGEWRCCCNLGMKVLPVGKRLHELDTSYMAEMQATALPVAALGPAGMQTVAELAAAHSGRDVQMKAW